MSKRFTRHWDLHQAPQGVLHIDQPVVDRQGFLGGKYEAPHLEEHKCLFFFASAGVQGTAPPLHRASMYSRSGCHNLFKRCINVQFVCSKLFLGHWL